MLIRLIVLTHDLVQKLRSFQEPRSKARRGAKPRDEALKIKWLGRIFRKEHCRFSLTDLL